MPLVTAQRDSLVGQVISQLKDVITSGEWPVGHRIPPESQLVASFDVGRNTIREAIRALAHAGLLEVRQGDGTYVRATSELSGALRTLCSSELREALEMRRMLEVESARLAAIRRTDADLAHLREALTARNEATAPVTTATQRGEQPDAEALDRAARLDADFHAAVVRCAGNGLVAELYRGIVETVAGTVAASQALLAEADAISHDDLVAAIEAGDATRAAQEAGEFLDRMIASIERAT